MELKVYLNQIKISSLEEFVNLQERCSNMEKKSVFVIQQGYENGKILAETVYKADLELTDCGDRPKNGYFRRNVLDSFFTSDEREKYEQMYELWKKINNDKAYYDKKIAFWFDNPLWEKTYKESFLTLAKECEAGLKSDIKFKNVMLILFKWIDIYFPEIFTATKTLSRFPKFIYTGLVRTNEYMFLRLLSLCGCDVYAVALGGTENIKVNNISFYAQIVTGKENAVIKIEEYDRNKTIEHFKEMKNKQAEKVPVNVKNTYTESHQAEKESPGIDYRKKTQKNIGPKPDMEYEQIARLASSIVMITVFDKNKKPFATGSGVIINKGGYVLTNCHVISGGEFYSVKLEEDDDIKYTDELIKYNQQTDLALIRIGAVNRTPIEICDGGKLARGQKVVAIGSPLGLLNTVSDGIIAGFRVVNNVDMIQFTAPISHGSSGGAVLNMKGELIGISTAGFDDGQNLNLAVEYNTIRRFINGFI